MSFDIWTKGARMLVRLLWPGLRSIWRSSPGGLALLWSHQAPCGMVGQALRRSSRLRYIDPAFEINIRLNDWQWGKTILSAPTQICWQQALDMKYARQPFNRSSKNSKTVVLCTRRHMPILAHDLTSREAHLVKHRWVIGCVHCYQHVGFRC